MRRPGAPVLLLCCAVAIASLAPAASAAAAPPRLQAAAASAVLAARGPAGVRTAFAFERRGLLVSAGGSGAVRLIASSGATASASPARRRGALAALEVSGLGLTPLTAAHARVLPAGARAYVLGSPLGYEADRLRAVTLPRLRLAGTRSIRVRGTLPASFAGAPVVTAGGAVIGAVASVASGGWRLAPRGALLALAGAHAAPGAGNGSPPILSFLIAGVLIFAAGAAFGLMRARRRRQLELEARMRSARRAAGAVEEQQPLVRLRTQQGSQPAAAGGRGATSGEPGGRGEPGGQEPGAAATGQGAAAGQGAATGQGAAGEEDFEVIVKSSEQT